MTPMTRVEQSERRIVTPEEARDYLGRKEPRGDWSLDDLAHTVATEPDRTRAAVVKALRDEADRCAQMSDDFTAKRLNVRADAIENGAPL